MEWLVRSCRDHFGRKEKQIMAARPAFGNWPLNLAVGQFLLTPVSG